MLQTIIFNIAKYFIEKYAREAIQIGSKKLLDSLDDGISSADINNFLDKARRSNKNNLTVENKNRIMSFA